MNTEIGFQKRNRRQITLVSDPRFLQDKAQQPDWPDQQKLKVFEERRFFTFYLMAYKLEDPGNDEDGKVDQPWPFRAGIYPECKTFHQHHQHQHDAADQKRQPHIE